LLPELLRATSDVAVVFAGLNVATAARGKGRKSAPPLDCPVVVLALRLATSVSVDVVAGEIAAFEYGDPFADDEDDDEVIDADDEDEPDTYGDDADDDDESSELSLRDAVVLGANAPEPMTLPEAHPLRRWLERHLGALVTGSVR
jgi:hypothetical protein